jgi:predicted nucleic acid-binding protein
MIDAFWDSSSLVPLCTTQASSAQAQQLVKEYSIVAWWSTPIEVASAIQRLTRTGEITQQESMTAYQRRKKLLRACREIQATETVREQAEVLIQNYPLKAADALQIAAAWVWTMGDPAGSTLISGDRQVLTVAKDLGFTAIQC